MAEHASLAQDADVAHEMGLNPPAIERRLRAVGLGQDDMVRIARIRDEVVGHATEYASAFFNYLQPFDDARDLLRNRELIEQARRLKVEHLHAMVAGNYGSDYAQQRLRLGMLYSRAHLEIPTFMGAFHNLLRMIGAGVLKNARSSGEGFEDFMALEKVAFFDLALITDVMVLDRERTIRRQQEAIRELSTPVLQLRDRLLMLPIIGMIDTHRARMLTESLLHAIRANRAKVAVIDVTGVAAVDTKVANHILQTVAAAKLMGATVIVTGISAEVAQTLVNLGVDLNKLRTIGDLQGGIEEAEQLIGYQVVAPVREARPSLLNGATPP
ncbi:MAG TPA: protoglobin domain-containing protein [Polyangia bacterium]|nr:protoglobin domain-containing protein [Polyangia bacterium]